MQDQSGASSLALCGATVLANRVEERWKWQFFQVLTSPSDLAGMTSPVREVFMLIP
jgi:hypothetical protein